MILWEGRLPQKLSPEISDFNSSIKVDARMYKEDIQGSMAHVKMLNKQGIIDENERNKLLDELSKISHELQNDILKIDGSVEDIHTFVEGELIKRLGDTGRKLHTARSRNDQVALDVRMYLRREIMEIIGLLQELISIFIERARENLNTIMPGYTHLQRAQPITMAHHLMAYVEMFNRDMGRLENCYKRTNIMPLGSSALAGTTYDLDRDYIKEILNFDDITKNSLDGVSDRDFVIELAAHISITMMHLSRFSEEIIIWCSWEFKFIELDDSYCTGSSIMPQKKNPDIAELIRGKTGRTYGNLITLLTIMKGLPLAYNKDMQEDKESIFDSVDTVKSCIKTLIPMVKTFKVLKENMRNSSYKWIY